SARTSQPRAGIGHEFRSFWKRALGRHSLRERAFLRYEVRKKTIREPKCGANDLAKFPKRHGCKARWTPWPMCIFGHGVRGLTLRSWRDSTCAQDPVAKAGGKFGHGVGVGRRVGVVEKAR